MSDQIAAIGPALRALREARGLRQYITAERARITKAMLSAYENGRRRPSLGTLDRILGALEAGWGDLARAMERVARRG